MPRNQNLDGSPGTPPAGMEKLSPSVLSLPPCSLSPSRPFFLLFSHGVCYFYPLPIPHAKPTTISSPITAKWLVALNKERRKRKKKCVGASNSQWWWAWTLASENRCARATPPSCATLSFLSFSFLTDDMYTRTVSTAKWCCENYNVCNERSSMLDSEWMLTSVKCYCNELLWIIVGGTEIWNRQPF